MKAALTALAVLGLCLLGAAVAQVPPPPPGEPRSGEPRSDVIRPAPDGSGPSHVFWLSGPPPGDPGEDVMGVVDPLFAAVRLYAIRRPGDGVPAPLAARRRALGACALPIDFRVWQIYQLKDRVILEGVPADNPAGYTVASAALRSKTVVLSRSIAASGNTARLEAAGQAVDRRDWDPAAAIQCGPLSEAARAGASAPYKARRAVNNPARTILLDNHADALAPSPLLIVRAPRRGAFRLYSARELEPGGGFRVVQISEARPSSDGMARIATRLLLFRGNGGAPVSVVEFDDARLRSKLGQRPLAVTPAGELLAMGRPDNRDFQLFSCGRLGVKAQSAAQAGGAVCREEAEASITLRDTGAARPVVLGDAAAEPAGTPGDGAAPRNAAVIFARLQALLKPWTVSADALPRDCRAAAGCGVKGNANYVPIAGLRMTRGDYTRTGVAYAQTAQGIPAATAFLAADRTAFEAALRAVHEGRAGAPGNLKDEYDGELGIDCSALVQMAWGGEGSGGRLSTAVLQTARLGYGCPNRIPDIGHLRAGDAIGLNTAGIAHVVLFAEPLTIDGASETWLVLESASGCGGVCWSLYDPSFFNGWGLYRAAGRSDRPCRADPTGRTDIRSRPIPLNRDGWRQMLAGVAP